MQKEKVKRGTTDKIPRPYRSCTGFENLGLGLSRSKKGAIEKRMDNRQTSSFSLGDKKVSSNLHQREKKEKKPTPYIDPIKPAPASKNLGPNLWSEPGKKNSDVFIGVKK